MTVEQWLNTELGVQIWNGKYKNGDETFDQWLDRISRGNEDVKRLIIEQKFLFGGRTLANRGLNNGSYSNCYSSGYVKDDLEDIMSVNSKLAMTYKAQGGQGVSLSLIRPKGASIAGRYISDGIVPIMEMFNKTTECITQGGCISEDCKVLTNRGYIPIKDIVIGDKAWTKKGWIEINYLFNKGEQEVFEVITRKGYRIETTEDHKYCVDAFTSKKLKELKVGDKVNLISGDVIGDSVYLQTGEKVSEELAYFLGYFNGNGWVSPIKNSGSLTMHWDQTEIKNKLIDIIKFLGFETHICEEKEGSFLRLYLNKEFIAWLDENSLLKNKTKYIKIPEFIFNCNKEIISSYISGSLDSDGTIYDSSFKYSTVSKDYAEEFICLLQMLGYFPSLSVQYREGKEPLYDIIDSFRRNQYLPELSVKFNVKFVDFTTNSKYRTPYTLENINMRAAETGVAHLKKVSKKSEIGLFSYLDINKSPYAPIIYDEITEINSLGVKHVYDISLVEEHFFMCNGFYVSNSRKGALMISLDITHKEAETFITIKSNPEKINKANLSVEIDDEFMQMVKESYYNREDYTMDIERTYGGKVIKYTICPIKIYKLLMQKAWESAEPGVIYTNRFRNYNLMQFCDDYQIETCNPCGEQPLPKDGACNLGSINLSQYVIAPFTTIASFDFSEFKNDVAIAIRALDSLIDENLKNHAMDAQREMSKNYRNIGLGIMGLADTFAKLGIVYGSSQSIELMETIMKAMLRQSIITSSELAEEFGTFPKYTNELFDSEIIKNVLDDKEIEFYRISGLRNCSLLSIAPTGTLGTMLNISTGIEPNFALSFKRRTISLGGKEEIHDVYCGVAQECIDILGTKSLPKYLVTSHDINWRDRINLQSAAQKYVDTAISSTINLPKEITVEEVEELYLYAWEKGLKGVTIFRDGSREAILTLGNEDTKKGDDFFTRPTELDADVIHFKNDSQQWVAFVGVRDGKPFEIFTGPVDMELFPIPKSVKSGKIIKVKEEGKETRYDFRYIDSYGYQNTLGGLSRCFNKEYWNYARLVSGMLRQQVSIHSVVEIVEGMHTDSETLHSWKNGVIRALKSFIPDGTKSSKKCPECGEDILYIGGCEQCTCGWSKCS